MHQVPDSIGGYKVVRELGRGAMGTVYLAYQDSLGRDLAIKLMSNEVVRDEEFIERFRREGRIAARLRHPNIVQVYDFSDRDGLYFIAMEYLGSRTLKDYIRERGRVPLAEACRLSEQLLAALEHAHRQGVVHRDIKPANVMVTDQGDAALTDFSIAQMKSATKLTQTGSVLGTPEYMAPEQFEGKADGRSDLYATGVILYEMLTGFSPFHAETIAEVMKKQLFTSPDPPSVVDFTIPEALSQVVVKSLAKNPEERYQAAGDMSLALKACLTGLEPGPAPPVSLVPPLPAPVPPVPAPTPPAKLCQACGQAVERQRFCPACGHDTSKAVVVLPPGPSPTPRPTPIPTPTPIPEKVTAPPSPAPQPSAGFLEEQGTAILGWAAVGCFALIGPWFGLKNNWTETLATGGLVGMVTLLPSSLGLSLFLFVRRASTLQVVAPFCIALGLAIALALLLLHLMHRYV